jgi:TrmH family RNA methyltransferase
MLPTAPITSKSNARVKALRASFSGDASRPGDLVGLEGEHLIAEALNSAITLETVYLREGSDAVLLRPSLAALQNRNLCLLSRDAFDSATHTHSPQGIAAIIIIPQPKILASRPNPGMTLFLEGIQDPGNLGTLIRSAEAFGVRRIFVTPSTANSWNPKAMRASAGSVLRVPIYVVSLDEFADNMRWGGTKMSAAVARSHRAISLDQANLHAPCAIMIGNEGAGLSSAALALADEHIHIHCATESLNAAVAGSILMYEASRQNGQLFAPGVL